MKVAFRIPIRLKILVTLLFAVTAVVSVIVFTMAGLFHEDKTTYINDLVSMTSLSTAEETHSLLSGYRDRVSVYIRIMSDRDLAPGERDELLRDLFRDFPELVAVAAYRDGVEIAGAYSTGQLEEAGLSKEALQGFQQEHPFSPERLRQGRMLVENSTLSAKLPTLTMAFEATGEEGRNDIVAAAVIRLDALLRLSARSRVFEVSIADAEGTLLAHPDPARVARREKAVLPAEAQQVVGRGGASVTLDYDDGGSRQIGGFADAGLGRVLAVVRSPKSVAYLASRDLLGQLGQVALVLLACGALLGLFGAQQITRPLERLSGATREIGEGKFDVRVNVASKDEIGDLAGSFNRMATGLEEREAALRSAQAQLVQSEKMAAFGQLGAGIAHEVKNPLAGILGCAQIAVKKAEPGTVIHTNLQLIEKETKRCKSIIDNLLRFARQEKAFLEPIGVNAVVEDAAAIVDHQLEMNQVRLETDLAPGLPAVLGSSNQLQQVLMNLMINAQQAMEGAPGIVTVRTRKTESGGVEIRVQDTGPGIPKEIADRIFEPFFTTKPSGKGTGLGLSVSFGIVKDHGGEIAVESIPGRGATFVITLPSHAPAPAPDGQLESVTA